MELNQQQNAMASQLGKMLRDSFGKGPQSIYINIRRPFIVVYMRQFISPMENILLDKGKQDIVEQTRSHLMEALAPEMKTCVRLILGMEVKEFYYDWNFHNLTGVLVMVEEMGEAQQEEIRSTEYPGKKSLHEEIDTITSLVQKKPDCIDSCQMNHRTIIVVRDNILVPIEKELIRLGFEQTLKLAKRNLEKRYLHNRARFEPILGTKVHDIFVDWNLQSDKSVIVIIKHSNVT